MAELGVLDLRRESGFHLAFYGLCLATTWWFYLRRRVLVRAVPSLATATV